MKKSKVWVELFCIFIAICTSLGAFYHKIEPRGESEGLALILIPLYYVICKLIISCGSMLLEKEFFQRREVKNRVEAIFLSGNIISFLACMVFFLICFMPYLINFAPGTMEDDAYVQLCQYFGTREMTGHHPVVVTNIMGKFFDFGKDVLGSQAEGLYLYIRLQTLLQILGFCYVLNVLSRLNVPIVLRWLALIFYGFLPIFPMWGCTLSKDTAYYIFMLFFVVSLIDFLAFFPEKVKWWNVILLLMSSLGVTLYRNNGRYVVVITILSIMIFYRKNIKMWILVLACCLLSVLYIEKVYMPENNIKEGPVKEMLSVPMQQTARYIKECYDDITEDERIVLEAVFKEELRAIGEAYHPEFADPVKERFVTYPEDGLIRKYLKVWFQQFWKHPKVYVKAFLNHVYGYFYVDRECFQDPMAVFTYVNFSQRWSDDNMELEFEEKDHEKRLFYENWFYILNELPVTKIFFRMSTYVIILLGLCVNMLAKNRIRQITVLVPALCSLLICMVSPVGACLRYMLSIIVLLPVLVAWNDYSIKNENG